MIEVRGADDLYKLSRTLKGLAGANGVQKEFNQAINRAMKPLKAAVKQSARQSLPQRGGLAARVASSRLTTRRPNTKRGLRLVSRGTLSLWHLDQGQVRHRAADGWGDTQSITPGWWTKPTEAAAPSVRREVQAAMDEVVKRISRAV